MNKVDIVSIGAAQSDPATSHARIDTGLRHAVLGAGDAVGGAWPSGPPSPKPGSWPFRTTPNLRSMPGPPAKAPTPIGELVRTYTQRS